MLDGEKHSVEKEATSTGRKAPKVQRDRETEMLEAPPFYTGRESCRNGGSRRWV